LLRKGQVRVNKGRIKPVYRLKNGDIVRIPPLNRPSADDTLRPPDNLCRRLDSTAILYEDDALIALNKPSGIAVHGGSGITFGVIEILRYLRPECAELALVHRLDRMTSGCLLLAKQRQVLLQLHDLLRQGRMKKQYTALVAGRWEGGSRQIDKALQKNRQLSGERMVQVDDDGQFATSQFTPRRIYATSSLMDVHIDTGRMHQIRVHAAYLNHPVAGDEKYGDAEFNVQMRQLGLKRQFLHASRIEFTMPDTGKRIAIEAPLDTTLLHVLARLED
jgi:23S rRNA pseudouridine955/2504/2580 synthase